MRLFMTELAVRSLEESVAWYTAHGFRIEFQNSDQPFALLSDAQGGRLAFKPGLPQPASVILHLEVTDLPSGEVYVSDEGYKRVMLTDPDGYRVCCFQWVN